MRLFTSHTSQPKAAALALLATITLSLYLPVRNYLFLSFDDPLYVTANEHVLRGLSLQNLIWAVSNMSAGFWHPLTMISHMLDVELFGLNAGAHHLINVLFHMASVLLLFVILERMTGAVWRSALVAGLFALHPLNVESVAWVAERKNVLSTLMWMVVLGAYVSYAKEPRWKRYWVLMGVFVLGLMTKPMLVTLPCVFVLLDYWPLGRLGNSSKELRQRLWPLLREKLPLLVPVGLSSLLAVKAESQLGALTGLEVLPVGVRLGNAVVSYGLYLKKMVWPVDLAVFYPHPESSLELWWVVLSGVVLTVISLGVWQRRWRSRYLVTGWLWYLGTLFPVSGLIQVGVHGMADRYAYVPLIGVFIMLAWGVEEAGERVRVRGEWLALAWIGVLLPMLAVTRTQIGYWRDSTTLFQQALNTTSNNHVAHTVLGAEALEKKRFGEAAQEFQTALEIKPTYARAHNNLGLLFLEQGKLDQSAISFSEALRINSRFTAARNNLGTALLRKGELGEAKAHFDRVLKISPEDSKAHSNMGLTMAAQGHFEEAITWYRRALEIYPDFYDAHNNLGVALMEMDQMESAIGHFGVALELNPNNVEAHANLGLALAKVGRMEDAVEVLSGAIQIAPSFASSYYYLAMVEAFLGNNERAIENLQEVLRLDPAHETAKERLNSLLSATQGQPH